MNPENIQMKGQLWNLMKNQPNSPEFFERKAKNIALVMDLTALEIIQDISVENNTQKNLKSAVFALILFYFHAYDLMCFAYQKEKRIEFLKALFIALEKEIPLNIELDDSKKSILKLLWQMIEKEAENSNPAPLPRIKPGYLPLSVAEFPDYIADLLEISDSTSRTQIAIKIQGSVLYLDFASLLSPNV